MRPAEGTTFEELALVVRWRDMHPPPAHSDHVQPVCMYIMLNLTRPAVNVATLWTHKTLAH